jgi:hypothetical protein
MMGFVGPLHTLKMMTVAVVGCVIIKVVKGSQAIRILRYAHKI